MGQGRMRLLKDVTEQNRRSTRFKQYWKTDGMGLYTSILTPKKSSRTVLLIKFPFLSIPKIFSNEAVAKISTY